MTTLQLTSGNVGLTFETSLLDKHECSVALYLLVWQSVGLSDLQSDTPAGNVGQTNGCIAAAHSVWDLHFQ